MLTCAVVCVVTFAVVCVTGDVWVSAVAGALVEATRTGVRAVAVERVAVEARRDE